MLELKDICYSPMDEDKILIPEDEITKKEIIKHVSVKIDERFIAVTGPNGSGKSTLAKLISGIIRPTSGRILFDGKDITDYSITERANAGISYAFQAPVRFKGLTVKDLITLAKGRDATPSLDEICDILSQVGLCARDYVNREVNASLSGGELKRIEIAMTIARGTELTIFDEPEAGIDLWSFNNLIRVFENMYKSIKGSIIIISHQERILKIADRIILLDNGKIKKDGTRDEVMPYLLDSGEACSTLREKMK